MIRRVIVVGSVLVLAGICLGSLPGIGGKSKHLARPNNDPVVVFPVKRQDSNPVILQAARAAAVDTLLAAGNQQFPSPPKIKTLAEMRTVSTPADAVFIAAEAIKRVPESRRPFIRYVWVRKYLQEHFQAMSLVCAHISRHPILLGPKDYVVIDKQLIQIDLSRLALIDERKDMQEMIDTWEELQFDPAFNLLVTKDMLRFLNPEQTFKASMREWVIVDKDKEMIQDGQKVMGRWVARIVSKEMKVKDLLSLEDIELVRINGEHTPAEPFNFLQEQTRSLAPVVSYDYFTTRALTTIQDKGLYKEVFGGLYYKFAGVPKANGRGTDEDALYELLGIGNVEHGVTAEKIFARLRSDQRIGMFRSKVTGRPRQAEWFQSLAGRETIAWVFVTHDIAASDIDIGQHPIMNLLKFNDKAREVVFGRTNGTQGFALYNNKGALQDEVPPDIAADRTVPAPYHTRLQCAISCMRCHYIPGETLGMQPMQNDVKTLLSTYLNAYGDLTQLKQFITDSVARIDGLYSGSPDNALRLARNDLAKIFIQAAGPWPNTKDQTIIVKLATEHVARIYSEYNWEMVTPAKALYELGYEVPQDMVKDVLYQLLPPEISASDGVIVPEDPRIWALKQGVEINRTDWAFVYPFAAARMQRTLADVNRRRVKENMPVQKGA